MPNMYCSACGQGIKYLYSKPEECPSCKKIFASIKIEHLDPKESESEPKDRFESTPLRKKLKFIKNISVKTEGVHVEKLGQVIASNPGEKRQKRSPVSQSDFKKSIFEQKSQSVD